MGAHPRVRALTPPPLMSHKIVSRSLIVLIVILLNVADVRSSEKSESEILLKFRESLVNNEALSDWNDTKPPCKATSGGNWKGVLCINGTVTGLRLENMGLKGSIDVESLQELPSLITISLMNNDFDGSLPDLKKLASLKTMYFSNNKFSGTIPSNAFEGMSSLKKIHLANNAFSGQIPSSLASLSRLVELNLEHNQFSGEIPNFNQKRWLLFNVSNNLLEGQIPSNLKSFDSSSFAGNANLCGAPLAMCRPNGNLSVATIVIVSIAVFAALVAIIVVIIILQRRKQTPQQEEASLGGTQRDVENVDHNNNNKDKINNNSNQASDHLDKVEQGSSSPDRSHRGQGHERKKSDPNVMLTFLRDDRTRFDMTDLLKASAEILGSGIFGSTYKAVIGDGVTMVVKRYRRMNNFDKEEFNEHMARLGRLKHQNLLPLVAFYYRKEEKLLVSDHVNNVSLAVHLHGNKSRGHPTPDWATRLKIIKGVTRGLDYLYTELPTLIAPHGHLKSSNVLLSPSFEPLLTDYGLIPVVNPEHAQDNMIAYKSPEYKQTRRITKKTDVWSLGILILEILTGKFPSNFLQQGKGSDMDLTVWVQSIVHEEWTTEVFDKDMSGTRGSEGEIIKLLKIGLRCCEADVEKRLDIKEALQNIEEIREKDGNNDFHSS